MRSTFILLTVSFLLTACSAIPFMDGGDDRPTTAMPAASNEAQVFEIKNADRGMARRVKVTLNGRTVDTLSMPRGRSQSSSHCCTEDGCKEIEPLQACTAFKMTCDKDGACTRSTPAAAKRQL